MNVQEEMGLLLRARGGDTWAQNRFIEKWKSLALSTFAEVIGCYIDGHHQSFGNVLEALVECVRAYDLSKGGIADFIRLVSRRRAIDFIRKDRKNRRAERFEVHFSELELECVDSHGKPITFEEWYPDPRSLEDSVIQSKEMEEFQKILHLFDVSANWCHGKWHRDKLNRAGSIIEHVTGNINLVRKIIATRKFPIRSLAREFGMSPKTIFRYRDLVLGVLLFILHREGALYIYGDRIMYIEGEIV